MGSQCYLIGDCIKTEKEQEITIDNNNIKNNSINNNNIYNNYSITGEGSKINNSSRLKETNYNSQDSGKIQEIIKKNEENLKLIDGYKQKIKELNLKIENDSKQNNLLINNYKQQINQLNLTINQMKNNVNQKNLLNEERIKNQKEINKLQSEIIKLQQKIKDLESGLKEPTILIGLNNIGATCYMNATLQCLSNTQKLTKYFLNKYIEKHDNIMANEYYKLLIHLWDIKNNNSSYSPNSFKEVLSKENPLFAGIAANDSKDLINFLLERFHQELNESNQSNINNNMLQDDQSNEQVMLKLFLQDFKEKFNSPISHLFYGVMETKSQCHGCQIIKYNFQVYSFIEFPLQEVNKYCYNNGKRPLYNNDGTNPDVDLYECFEYYGKVDLMNGENQMYCNICKKLCDSFYSTTIYSTPNYLIINLNRGKGAVYECKVNFPEQLNLFNFVSYKIGITVFELYAVICHLGPSSMGGHFVAYCRNRIDNKWYLYNDGMVSKCTQTYQYQNGMPYILFYRTLKSS